MAKKKDVASTSVLFCILFFSLEAIAQIQTLGPVSLNLPAGWDCQNQDKNFICLDQSPTSQKNSAIVVSFKNRTAEDALVVYRDQLSRPRTLYQGDLAVPSQPKGLSDRNINEVLWVEGIHLGSEVPDYYTHYYATVAGTHAVLISVSIEKLAYREILTLLTPTINSVRLNVTQSAGDLLSQSNAQELIGEAQSSGAHNSKNVLNILGHTIPRSYAYLGAGFLVVLIFLGYALLTD